MATSTDTDFLIKSFLPSNGRKRLRTKTKMDTAADLAADPDIDDDADNFQHSSKLLSNSK